MTTLQKLAFNASLTPTPSPDWKQSGFLGVVNSPKTKPHGSTGNQNAVHPSGKKVSGEILTIGVPKGTRGKLARVAHPGKLSPWIRKAIAEKLARDGHPPILDS